MQWCQLVDKWFDQVAQLVHAVLLINSIGYFIFGYVLAMYSLIYYDHVDL